MVRVERTYDVVFAGLAQAGHCVGKGQYIGRTHGPDLFVPRPGGVPEIAVGDAAPVDVVPEEGGRRADAPGERYRLARIAALEGGDGHFDGRGDLGVVPESRLDDVAASRGDRHGRLRRRVIDEVASRSHSPAARECAVRHGILRLRSRGAEGAQEEEDNRHLASHMVLLLVRTMFL